MIGWDMSAALRMAEALGYCTVAAARILPEIEMIKVRAFNEQGGADDQ